MARPVTAPVVHLVTAADARSTLCGQRTRKGPAVPYRLVTAPPRPPGVERVCPACAAARWPA